MSQSRWAPDSPGLGFGGSERHYRLPAPDPASTRARSDQIPRRRADLDLSVSFDDALVCDEAGVEPVALAGRV